MQHDLLGLFAEKGCDAQNIVFFFSVVYEDSYKSKVFTY